MKQLLLALVSLPQNGPQFNLMERTEYSLSEYSLTGPTKSAEWQPILNQAVQMGLDGAVEFLLANDYSMIYLHQS